MKFFKRHTRPVGVNSWGWQASLIRTKGREGASSIRDNENFVRPGQDDLQPGVLRTEAGRDVLLRRQNGELLNLTKLAKAREADQVVHQADGQVDPAMQAALNQPAQGRDGVGGIGAPAAPVQRGDTWRAWRAGRTPDSVANNLRTAQTSARVAARLRRAIRRERSDNIGGLRQTVNTGTAALQAGLETTRQAVNDVKFAYLLTKLDAGRQTRLRQAVAAFEQEHKTTLDLRNPEHVAMLKEVSRVRAYRAAIDEVASLALHNRRDRDRLRLIVRNHLGGSGNEIVRMDRAQRNLVSQMLLLEVPGLSRQGVPMAERRALFQAVKNLRALDDVGILSSGLMHRFAVAQDSVQKWADSSVSQQRIYAAEHVGALAAVALDGRLPDDVLGFDSRMDDSARAIARYGALKNGEPVEIAEARAHLAVAGRRLAHALRLKGDGQNNQPEAARRMDGKAHTSGAQMFLNGGLGDVVIDARFTAAMRASFGDEAGRDVGLLVANVALLQRKVAPYNMLADARQKYDQIVQRGQNIGLHEPTFGAHRLRRSFARANVKHWQTVIAHDQAVARLDSLKLQPASAERNRQIQTARTEVRRLSDLLESPRSPMARAVRQFRQSRQTIAAQRRQKEQRLEYVKGRIQFHENTIADRLAAHPAGNHRVALAHNYNRLEQRHAQRRALETELTRLHMLDTTIRDVLANRGRLDELQGMGLDATDLEKMGLSHDERAHVTATVGQHIKNGLVSPDQVKGTTAQINTVVQRLVGDSSAEKMMTRQLQKTDQHKANTFLNTLFRSVTRQHEEFNLQASDDAVKAAFRAKLMELEPDLSRTQRRQLAAGQQQLVDARGHLNDTATRLLRNDRAIREHAENLRGLIDAQGLQLVMTGEGSMTTVQPPEAIDGARKLQKAVAFRRQINAQRRAGYRIPNRLIRRYERALRDVRAADLSALRLNFRTDQATADNTVNQLANAPRNDARLQAVDAVAYIGYTGPAARTRLEANALRYQAQIDRALAQRRQILGPQYDGFVRDMVRGAVLAARPQGLNLDYERFDHYDASKHRAAIDATLTEWGLNTDYHRSEIDAVVFNTRALTDQEIGDSWGAAVAGESVSTVELGQWNRDLEENLTHLNMLAPTQHSELIDRALHAVRAMPIQGKMELNLTRDVMVNLGFDIPLDKKDEGIGVGIRAGMNRGAILEIKRSAFDYEVRLRSHNYGLSGSVGVPFFDINGARTSRDGVSIHFKDAEATQAFVAKILSGREVTTNDWSQNAGVEDTTKTSSSIGLEFGIGAEVEALGVKFAVGPGVAVSGSRNKNTTSYRTSEGFEEKHRLVRNFRVRATFEVGVGVQLGPAKAEAGLKGWIGKEGALIDRMKFEYSDDGQLKGAEYFRGVTLVSRDPATMLRLVDDNAQTRAMLDRPVEFGGTTETYGKRIADMLATATQNDTFVVEYKLDKTVVQAIGDLQARRKGATSKQIKKIDEQIKALLHDRSNYRPKGAMLNPVRFDSESNGWDLLLVSTTKEASAKTRFASGFVPAPTMEAADQPRLAQQLA